MIITSVCVCFFESSLRNIRSELPDCDRVLVPGSQFADDCAINSRSEPWLRSILVIFKEKIFSWVIVRVQDKRRPSGHKFIQAQISTKEVKDVKDLESSLTKTQVLQIIKKTQVSSWGSTEWNWKIVQIALYTHWKIVSKKRLVTRLHLPVLLGCWGAAMTGHLGRIAAPYNKLGYIYMRLYQKSFF